MEQLKLGEMEQKFADLIWQQAPIGSGELVRLCEAQFGWKKSTTYTMLKRLCDRGLFCNSGGRVQVLLQKQEFHAMQGESFIAETFGGSLPRFLAAFTRRHRLSAEEIAQLQQLIDQHREE